MSHHEGQTTDERLVYMANQIATFFESQPAEKAAAGVAEHINNFWEPRMRRRFLELVEAGGITLKPALKDAIPAIRRPKDMADAD